MKLLLMSLSILFIKNKWKYAIMILSLMFIMQMMVIFSPGTQMNFTAENLLMPQMSPLLIMLAIWITMMMILSSQTQILKKNKKPLMFLYLMLWLLVTTMYVFSLDKMIYFYIFFEMSLIPIILMILIWGYQPERLQASMYMMLYTISCSLPLLLTIMINMNYFKTTSFLFISIMFTKCDNLLTIPLLIAFLVKSPMFLIHLWLPKAHVEAPMAGSMILAAILLKLGGYGMIMMNTMLEINMTKKMILMISLVGGVMSCILCMSQVDMKSLIAYSSINHMALMIMGLMSNMMFGLKMAILIMIAHGLSSSAMFMMSGLMFEKSMSRMMLMNKSLLMIAPNLSMFWFILCMINMGAPPSINLISEVMLIGVSMKFMKLNMIILGLIIFMSAAYNLYLYTGMNHGNKNKKSISLDVLNKNYNLSNLLQIYPTFTLSLMLFFML